MSRSPNLASITLSGFASTLLTQIKHAWSDVSTLHDNDRLILQQARSQTAEFRVIDGIVWTAKQKIVVPASMVTEIISLAHDLPTAGHFGVRKTILTL